MSISVAISQRWAPSSLMRDSSPQCRLTAAVRSVRLGQDPCDQPHRRADTADRGEIVADGRVLVDILNGLPVFHPLTGAAIGYVHSKDSGACSASVGGPTALRASPTPQSDATPI